MSRFFGPFLSPHGLLFKPMGFATWTRSLPSKLMICSSKGWLNKVEFCPFVFLSHFTCAPIELELQAHTYLFRFNHLLETHYVIYLQSFFSVNICNRKGISYSAKGCLMCSRSYLDKLKLLAFIYGPPLKSICCNRWESRVSLVV